MPIGGLLYIIWDVEKNNKKMLDKPKEILY